MPYYEDEIAFLQQQAETRRIVTQTAANPVSGRHARQIRRLSVDYPWLSPGVALTLAKGNYSPEDAKTIALMDLRSQYKENPAKFGEVRQTNPKKRLMSWLKELDGYVKQSETPQSGSAAFDPAITQRPYQFGSITDAEVRQLRNVARDALLTGDRVVMTAALGLINERSTKQKDPYTISRSSSLSPTGRAIAGATVDPISEKVIGPAEQYVVAPALEATAAVAKPVVRTAALTAQSMYEAAIATVRTGQGVRAPGTGDLLAAAVRGDSPDEAVAHFAATGQRARKALVESVKERGITGPAQLIAAQTQGGQALDDLVHGRSVDVGGGFLPSLDSETAKQAAATARYASPFLIGGHAWTPGRSLASSVFSPDSVAFNVASGLIDAAVAMKVDPAALALTGLGKFAMAQRTFENVGDAAEIVRNIENAGKNLGPRTFHGSTADWVDDVLVPYGGKARENAYGSGLYSTERWQTAGSYGATTVDNPDRANVLYRVHWRGEDAPRIVSVDAMPDDEMRNAMRSWVENQDWMDSDYKQIVLGDIERGTIGNVIQRLTAPFEKNLDEYLIDFRKQVLEPRFDALAYDGGVATGSAKHNAYVWVNERDIDVERVAQDVATGDPLVADAETEIAVRKAQLLRQAGAHEGRRPFIHGRNPIEWMYGKGSPIITKLTEETNGYKIWIASNKKFHPRLAYDLANSTDEGMTRQILASELGTTVDRVPKYREGLGIKRRSLTDLPSGSIDWEDQEGSAQLIDQFMTLAKASEEAKAEAFNKFVARNGRGDNFAVVDYLFDAFRQAMIDAKADVDKATELTRFTRQLWDDAQRWGVDAVTGENKPMRIAIGSEIFEFPFGPRTPGERLGSTIPLPDPHEVKRLVSSPAFKAIGMTSDQWAGAVGATDAAYSAWRIYKLARPAWTLKVVGDEQFRLAATGATSIITHPMSHIAIALGNPQEGTFFGKSWYEHIELGHGRFLGAAAGATAGGVEGAREDGLRGALIGTAVGGVVGYEASNLFGNWIAKTPSEQAIQDALTARKNLADQLIQDNPAITNAETRAIVDKQIPIPKSKGQQISTALRKKKTQIGQYRTDVTFSTWDARDRYGQGMTGRFADMKLNKGMYLDHFDAVDRTSQHWARGLVEDLHRMSSDTVYRKALKLSPQDFLDELWTEDWGVYVRKQMAAGRPDGDPWLRILDDRKWSDAYGMMLHDQLENLIGGDETLRQALLTGKWDNVPLVDKYGSANPEALALAKNYQEAGSGPQWVKVQRVVPIRKSSRETDFGKFRSGVNALFDALMTRPSNYLSRHPAFVQKYWGDVPQLAPSLSPKARADLLARLGEANLPRQVEQEVRSALMRANSKGGMSLSAADNILKRRALDYTRDTLYDLSKKSNMMDTLRFVFPFGEAFKEILTVWAKLMYENPQVPRRLQQGIQAARESVFDPLTGLPTGTGNPNAAGLFHWDPRTQQEVWTIAATGNLTAIAMGGVPVPLKGSVRGLNMVGSLSPGVGPALSMPASFIVPDKPAWDGVRKILFPFGQQDTSNPLGLPGAEFAPTWMKHLSRIVADPRSDRTYAGAVSDVMAAKASTGEYDLQGPNSHDEINRLIQDSKKAADWLFAIDALTAATSPSAPGFDFYVKKNPDNEDLILLQTLRDDYRTFIDKHGYEKGFVKMIEKYGTDNILATTTKSVPTVAGLTTSTQQRDWARTHKDLVQAYPETWALFAPKGEGHSLTAYAAQMKSGQRDPEELLTGAQKANARLAEARLQATIDQELGGSVDNPRERAFVRQVKEKLAREYDGYGKNTPDMNRTKNRIRELERAAEDPQIKKTPLGKALVAYLDAREQGNATARKLGYSEVGMMEAEDASGLREQLRDYVKTELIKKVPEFRRMWELVLERELSD